MYCKKALKIQTKDAKQIVFDWNRAQRLVSERVEAQKKKLGRARVLILKARQEGISTWCASRIYQGCTLWGNRRGLVVADKLERTGDIFGIYERFDVNLPDALRPPRARALRHREMAWKSDSRITVETAGDADAGRGTTLHYLHASELAMWPRAEETWLALMQAVPFDGGEVFVESTAKGVGNLFHRLWQLAEAGESEWLPIFLPWWIHEEYQRELGPQDRLMLEASTDPWERKVQDEGIVWEGESHFLSAEQLWWRRAKIRDDFLGDERSFRQEYPATAREAFIATGDGFFDANALEEYDIRAIKPKRRGTFIALGAGYKLQGGERGFVKVWEDPDPFGHYVIGSDTAEGKVSAATDASLVDAEAERGGRDFSSADILKVSELVKDPNREGFMIRQGCLRQVGQVHGRMAPEVFAEQVWAAAQFWHCPGRLHGGGRPCLTGIERNHSSGQTVIQLLREKYHHPDMFVHQRLNVRGGTTTSYWGWVTDGTTRMPMLDALAALVREGSLGVCSVDTIREMFSFVRGDDGRPEAQEGTHDDRVISLAIAVQMSLHHRSDPVGEPSRPEIFDTPTGMDYT
jgi:hypothetical protein